MHGFESDGVVGRVCAGRTPADLAATLAAEIERIVRSEAFRASWSRWACSQRS